MQFRFFYLALLLSSLITVTTSCTEVEGCTDPNSVNFDPDATLDDGSCTYEGQVVFWYNEATADSLQADQATALTYYVDGEVVGSSATTVFWSDAPDCEAPGSVTVVKDLGIATNLTFPFRVVDDTGFEYFSGTLNFTANNCEQVELVF